MSETYSLRVLHLSDVHFRSADGAMPEWRREQVKREAWQRERVLGDAWRTNLAEVAKRGPAFDLVCVTGDIADWGLAQEYVRASPWIREILSAVSLSVDRLFVIPGNHDIQRDTERTSWATLRSAAASTDPGKLSKWMAGGPAPPGVDNTLRGAVSKRGDAFRAWVRDDLRAPHLLSGSSGHPLLGYRATVSIPRLPFRVHVIGLDTGWLAGDDHDALKLCVTEHQIGMNATKDGRPLEGLRIALAHHPLSECSDGSAAWRLLAELADVLLRGHQHDPLAEVRHDPDRGLVEFAAGCLYEGGEGHRYPNGFQVIDVTTDAAGRPWKYDVWFRAWSPRGHWHDDASIYRKAPEGRMSFDVHRGVDGPTITDGGSSAGKGDAVARIDAGVDVRVRNVDVDADAGAHGDSITDISAGGSVDVDGVRIRRRSSDGRP